MKIYIAGPMSGLPEFNYPAFHAAQDRLQEKGYEPFNPAKPEHIELNLSWEECMRRAIRQLLECDAIYLLNGWRSSKGARLEWIIAEQLGMQIFWETDPMPNLVLDK